MNETISARQGAATDTITHRIVMPILFLSFVAAILLCIHHHGFDLVLHLWLVVIFAALSLMNMKTRVYSLRLQDRVIRLEERLRLAALVPTAELPVLESLTTSQLIALRFASDAELPVLAARAAREDLTRKQIKELIVNWRPDTMRI
jgi:hypothetical protein